MGEGEGSSKTPCNVFPSKNMEIENPMINVCEMIGSHSEKFLSDPPIIRYPILP